MRWLIFSNEAVGAAIAAQGGVGRLLEADSNSGVVIKFLRMFASEAKQPQNDTRDSPRTSPRNESRHRTQDIQTGGRP